jgi:hypothetical protein
MYLAAAHSLGHSQLLFFAVCYYDPGQGCVMKPEAVVELMFDERPGDPNMEVLRDMAQ